MRDRLAKRMTRAQLAEAQRLAREWQAAFDARQQQGRLTMTQLRLSAALVVLVLLGTPWPDAAVPRTN